MAALKLVLSQARRHSLPQRASPFYSLTSHRSLSSSESNSNPRRRPSEPIPIQPVSYPVKPKPPPPEPSPSPEPEPQPLHPPPPPPSDSRRSWTREDIRYVKDAPSIAPVSYPSRVAPLPDDRVPAAAAAEEEVESERRKIEAENELRMRMAKAAEEERMKVPFPLLIKPKKNEKPPLLDLTEAIRQVKANAKAKFDETVEAHVRLGVDSKRTEMAVRGTVILPHGAPKAVSVAVFAQGAEAEEAKAAGADIVGGKELIEEIASGKNKLKVDKCFSTPGMAPHLGKIAQYLRKRRLMPDKKLGTLTSDIAGQLKELRQGRVEFKMESKSILHVGLGKVSYKEEALRENISAFMNAVLLAKPTGLKKTSKYAGYVLSVHINSTMGPGLPVSIQSLSKAADNYKKTHVV
ncbi:50S ribosomal protein L1 [Spatholobus suberectus]|nr:50S ribosomal protein L1 [Spatholobus suberectus]